MNEIDWSKLSEPFDEDIIKWKPEVTTKGRDKQPIMRNGQQVAGCTAHIDARIVMNRLDEVVGPANWSDSYRVVREDKSINVECTLTVCGVSKTDVGQSNDGGFADAFKSAYSDAFKRAAVKFGIGRHLYDMEMAWLPFDGYRITEAPEMSPQPKRQPIAKPAPVNGQAEPTQAYVPTGTKPHKQLHALGRETYGDDWDAKREELIGAVTKGRTTSSAELYPHELARLVEGMQRVKAAAG